MALEAVCNLFYPVEFCFLLATEPRHREIRVAEIVDAHEVDPGSQPADTIKFYVRKSVRTCEQLATAWPLLD
ncbi:hypothetical protein [Bradyrhizobium sp. LTSPM299]|uniref:hypothetical protein n=1 Tax=Bradyrhizobium sp. LTSPM299 TaxID=1619233 RepID=UPI0012E1ECA3|nr:hypothetical protein [Bradyrhizobium sp. LTSPM299]